MRLREFAERRQINEAVVAIPYLLELLIAAGAAGAMIASDPNTAKRIQQWFDSNPDQAKQYSKQIQDAQKSGALPKDPSKVGDAAFPIVSGLAKTWNWLTGGSTTGQAPSQPDQYVKDKNGLLRRKDADVDKQVTAQKIQSNILSNMTKFDNEQYANKALPYLKPGTQVTIGGKRMVVQAPGKAGGKAGFIPYQDLGTVQKQQVKPHIDDIVDFDAGNIGSADDDYMGTVSRPSRPSAGATDRKDWSANKPSAGTVDKQKDSPGFWNTIAGFFQGGKTDMSVGDDGATPAPTKKKDWSAKPSAGTVNKSVAGTADGDDIKVTVPPQAAPDINVDSDKPWDWSKPGPNTRPSAPGAIAGAPPVSGGVKDKGEAGTIAGAPPIARPGDEVGQGVQGATTGTGTQAGTQAGTGAQTGTVANTQATTQTQTGTVAQTQQSVAPATTMPPPVVAPPIVTPAPKYKTEPYKDQDVFYTGWRKGPPKKVIGL